MALLKEALNPSSVTVQVTAVASVGGASWTRLAGSGGIDQVKVPFDRFPQFVLRVAAVAAVLAPPVMIPVFVLSHSGQHLRR